MYCFLFLCSYFYNICNFWLIKPQSSVEVTTRIKPAQWIWIWIYIYIEVCIGNIHRFHFLDWTKKKEKCKHPKTNFY